MLGGGAVEEVRLYDPDAGRLAAIGHVLDGQAAARPTDSPPAPRVHATNHLDEAVRGADIVFSAIRVGGVHARTLDERVALDLGVLGQETVGPGGIAFGLRTVPVALRIAQRVRDLAPAAWVVNFTNPAGMITAAMQTVLGDRVVGICDSPIALTRRAARAVGLDPRRVAPDYVGLNHLGWLRGLRADGRDVLPQLLADDAALLSLEEGRLFGPDWIRSIGAIPNEYLYYFYFAREALAGITGAPATRGEYLARQQEAFYAAVADDPGAAWPTWRRVRAERDASYMREARAQGEERDAEDLQAGGYEGVALTLMAALRGGGGPAAMILGVRNGRVVPGLAPDAIVEVPCHVDAAGVTPLTSADPPTGHQLGLMAQVADVEALTVRAALDGDPDAAVQAFAVHPLVDSVTTARALLAGYRSAIPQVDATFTRP